MQPSQFCLAWILHRKPWIVPIPGTTKVSRIQENCGAAHVTLTEADMRDLDEAISGLTFSLSYPECRDCSGLRLIALLLVNKLFCGLLQIIHRSVPPRYSHRHPLYHCWRGLVNRNLPIMPTSEPPIQPALRCSRSIHPKLERTSGFRPA